MRVDLSRPGTIFGQAGLSRARGARRHSSQTETASAGPSGAVSFGGPNLMPRRDSARPSRFDADRSVDPPCPHSPSGSEPPPLKRTNERGLRQGSRKSRERCASRDRPRPTPCRQWWVVSASHRPRNYGRQYFGFRRLFSVSIEASFGGRLTHSEIARANCTSELAKLEAVRSPSSNRGRCSSNDHRFSRNEQSNPLQKRPGSRVRLGRKNENLRRRCHCHGRAQQRNRPS
jgi:hypothetical protein